MRRHAAVLGLVAALCPALALAKPKPTPPPKPMPPVRYVCEDGTRLAVAFSAPEVTPATGVLRILGTGKEIMLAQSPSADGGRYTANGTEFWDKGKTATYTEGGTAVACRVKR